MKTQASHKAHQKDRTTQTERLVAYLTANPGATIIQIGKALDLPPSTVTARLTGLQSTGKVFGVDAGEFTAYTYDPNASNWERRAKDYQKTKDLDRIVKFVERFEHMWTPSGLEACRQLYRKVAAL